MCVCVCMCRVVDEKDFKIVVGSGLGMFAQVRTVHRLHRGHGCLDHKLQSVTWAPGQWTGAAYGGAVLACAQGVPTVAGFLAGFVMGIRM